MTTGIRTGIVGYGNLGKGVEAALARTDDLELVAVFTRRDPKELVLLNENIPVHSLDDIDGFQGKMDVLILCGGSRSDLPFQGPELAAKFITVDSFDTHAKIPAYFSRMDAAAKAAGTTAVIATGWDPGMFSINRLFGESILPDGETYTFWGRGVSQGHSDALRRVPGVAAAVQYTLPVPEAIERVRGGSMPRLSTREKHKRECFVVCEPGADKAEVERAIVTMPDYFEDYDTVVHFIQDEELRTKHGKMPHGGFVIRSGKTGTDNNTETIEFSLKLESNPEFTASVLVAYARAAYRLNCSGITGAQTVFDIAPGLLSPKSAADLRKELL